MALWCCRLRRSMASTRLARTCACTRTSVCMHRIACRTLAPRITPCSRISPRSDR
jgi:predicted aminopeptidase